MEFWEIIAFSKYGVIVFWKHAWPSICELVTHRKFVKQPLVLQYSSFPL